MKKREPGTAKWTVEGRVEAPVQTVADALLDVRAGRADETNALVLAREHQEEGGNLVLTGGPDRFTGHFGTSGDDYLVLFVDRAQRSVHVQTWFGGTYSVEPDGETASRVVLRVHNVVPNSGRLGQKVVRFRIESRLEGRLDTVLTALAARIGCTVQPAATAA